MSDKSNSVIILRSYWESIKGLPDDKQLLFLKSIIEYGMDSIEPEFTGIEKSFWIQIKATIDNSMKRYNTSIENGKKGGAPKGNNNAKKQPETTQEQPKSTQEQPKTTELQPETKVDNLYKDKDRYKDVDKDKDTYRTFKHLSITNVEANKIMKEGYTKYELDTILDGIENFANNKKYS